MFTNWGCGWLPCKPIAKLKAKIRSQKKQTYLDHGTRHTTRENDPNYDMRKYGMRTFKLHTSGMGVPM